MSEFLLLFLCFPVYLVVHVMCVAKSDGAEGLHVRIRYTVLHYFVYKCGQLVRAPLHYVIIVCVCVAKCWVWPMHVQLR